MVGMSRISNFRTNLRSANKRSEDPGVGKPSSSRDGVLLFSVNISPVSFCLSGILGMGGDKECEGPTYEEFKEGKVGRRILIFAQNDVNRSDLFGGQA